MSPKYSQTIANQEEAENVEMEQKSEHWRQLAHKQHCIPETEIPLPHEKSQWLIQTGSVGHGCYGRDQGQQRLRSQGSWLVGASASGRLEC